MARMHPEDGRMPLDATEGERRLYNFIKQYATPHKDYVCWFHPDAAGRQPDFVLYAKGLGLIVLEVKDWRINQLRGKCDEMQVTLKEGSREIVHPNPCYQAKGYVDRLCEKLGACRVLQSKNRRYVGKLQIPIGSMVVFSNISREEYSAEGLEKWIAPESILFEDDMGPYSRLALDGSGESLRRRLAQCNLPFPFQELSGKALEELHKALWAEVRIDLPERAGFDRTALADEIAALDHWQAKTAKSLKRGFLLLKGPPGSGKTIVLVHRCYYLLHKYDHRAAKILFVCYNIALARHLKRLLQEKGLPIGKGGIRVYHFYDLCAHILGESVKYDEKDGVYYDIVLDETAARVKKGEHGLGLMDVILADEGQDLDDRMLGILWGLVKPEGDFCLAVDPYQDLYRKGENPLKTMGISARGATRHLRRTYRSTRQIFEFSRRFIGDRVRPVDAEAPPLFDMDGPPGPRPYMPRFDGYEELADYVAADIGKSVRAREYRLAEIAVIYDDKVYAADGFGYAGRGWPKEIQSRLEWAAFPVKWVSEDLRAKELFDITAESVSLISIHSAKGLEFDLVYLTGIDRIQTEPATEDHVIRLVYVGITRARHRLVIPYVNENALIGRLLQGL